MIACPEFILNVNDDGASRQLVTGILEKAGFAVREATAGLDTLVMARDHPGLIILDVDLTDIDGLEVCRRLKQDPATATIPVLQTSAAPAEAERSVGGLAGGADGYLRHPIEPPELIATVNVLLRADSAEQRLRDTAVEWQRTFDSLHEAVAILDGHGRLLRHNTALRALAGGQPLEGRLLDDLLSELTEGTQTSLVDMAARSGQRESMDLSVAGRSFVATIDPIPQSGGSDQRFVLVLSDMTAVRRLADEERRRASELADSNQRNDTFLAMLARELRNPLNAISTANALTDRLGPAHERTARLHETISRQTEHLARLVDDLLEVSRFTRGRIALNRQRIDVADVLAQAIEVSQSLAASRQQTIHVSADRPLAIDGDPLRIEQVLTNVIHNALTYSEPGTDIHIAARLVDANVVVRIRDQGIGIPPSQLTRVFDLFAQVDHSLARSVGGLGIGLTLARTLVELHGGTIEAHSEGLGRGTEFVIRLPSAMLAATSDTQSARPTATPRRLNLVVIEDNQDAAELLGSLLEALDHRVHVTHDGLSGLTTAMSVRPDATLVDIGLPGIDGYQVAENLRGAPATRHSYLVAITGYGRPEDRARALAAGFDRYIVKPITLAALQEALAAAADAATARARARRQRVARSHPGAVSGRQRRE